MQPAVLPDVVIGRDDAVVADNGNVKESKITNLLHTAVMQLAGSASKEHAWQRLFRPYDIVGIKLNCPFGRIMSSHVAIVDAIFHRLKFAGVKDVNIIVFERYNRELEAAGFRVRRATKGVQCFGTDELPQGGYDSEPQIAGRVGTCFNKIVSKMCTAIINVLVLKDHALAGISVAMKNFFGAMHNPNKYHTNNCNPYIAELNSHPYIVNKVRFIVCDVILAQYNGGPRLQASMDMELQRHYCRKGPCRFRQDMPYYYRSSEKKDETSLFTASSQEAKIYLHCCHARIGNR